MLILFELSGEHPSLPIAEIRGVMEAERIRYEEIYHNRIALFKIEGNPKKICSRLAMSHSVNEVIGMGNENDILKIARDIEMEGSFKVDVVNIDKRCDSQYLRKKFGKIIENATGCKVNVRQPDNLDKIFSYKKLYLSREICKIDRHQFEERQKKPFLLPITMHPRLARAAINVARVKNGDVLIDPFCGTGSILIEGASIASVIGIEAKKWIADGCKKNLDFFGVNDAIIYNDDMRNIDIKGNAVVTDFPYGRSSYLSDKIKELYMDAFRKFDEWIDHGYIMVGMANRKFINIGKNFFDLIEIHPYRSHKSLTRFFSLYIKD